MADPTTFVADAAGAGDARLEDDEKDLLIAFLARRNELCPACGYNLRMMQSTQCPECGVALELRLHFRERGFRRWLASVVMATLGGGMSMLMAVMGGLALLSDVVWNRADWLMWWAFILHAIIASAYLLLLLRHRRLRARSPDRLRWYVVAGVLIALAPVGIMLSYYFSIMV